MSVSLSRTGQREMPTTWRTVEAPVRIWPIYAAALAFWMLTRWLVLVHQGAWPWMNAFVVEAARGIVVGSWADAVRPQLPALLGVPFVVIGATEQQTVAALYLVASLIQFCSFSVLARAAFPDAWRRQAFALLLFLLVPFNHSIHHYRDVPVVLASSAIFLLAAHWVSFPRGVSRDGRQAWSPLSIGWVVGASVLGVWSRAEVLTFVGGLLLMGLIVWRRAALRLVALYVVAALIGIGTFLGVSRLAGVDSGMAAHYQWHTFLDSTPDSWLTPECRAAPTENCRERDGLTYFGPAEPAGGVLPMVLNHPLLTVAKTLRSAVDNLWILFGANISTFPGVLWFAALVLLVYQPARAALRGLSTPLWMIAIAGVGQTVLPPLSWAPPHPQYHQQLVLPVVVLLAPILDSLTRASRGRLLVAAFFLASAALSVVRYTRYPGY